MEDKKYYLAKVKESFVNDQGKQVKTTRYKLVSAYGITDVEAKISELYRGVTFDWHISGVEESKIDEVVDVVKKATV